MTSGVLDSEQAPVRRPSERFRKDIQALRAAAVTAVVVYHVFPEALPGGFVGVDVFFVISGFLITTHLVQSPPERAADFARFWARRILRLLPAVTVVVLATLVGVVAWMASAQWMGMARDALASMFYVENWNLIAASTDYLDAHGAPSPFQHFWSLSVEEQYYVVWPLVLGAIFWVARRSTGLKAQPFLAAALAVAVGASFLEGLRLTHELPDVAYFSSLGRFWELGIGSLLAVTYPWLRERVTSPRTLMILLGLGWGGILLSVVAIDGQTPFPGYAALLPTLGTALVLLAADPAHGLNPRWLVHSRPVQLLGDVSYSMYLWHWPLIILIPVALRRPLALHEGMLVLAGTILVAWLSTRLVEDPVRKSSLFKGQTRRVFVLGLCLSVAVALVAGLLMLHVKRSVDRNRAEVARQLENSELCVGAAALDPGRECRVPRRLITTPAFARGDITNGILGCLNWPPFKDPLITCAEGREGADVRIALFGNSHAGHWVEVLDELGREHGWQVDTFVIGVCKTTVEKHAVDETVGTDSEECQRVQRTVVDQIGAGGYDAVIVSSMDRDAATGPDLYRRTLEELSDAAPVLVIRDTPAPMDPDNPPPDCIALHRDDRGACAGTPATWIAPDPVANQARELESERITVLDLNRYICGPKTCEAVVGGVIVYSDFNHLSKTFSKTLAPYLGPAIEAVLAAGDR